MSQKCLMTFVTMTIMTTSDEKSLKKLETFVVDRNGNVVPLHLKSRKEFPVFICRLSEATLAQSREPHVQTPEAAKSTFNFQFSTFN